MKTKRLTIIQLTLKDILSFFSLILIIIGLYALRDLVTGLFISVLVATALNPSVTHLEKLKIPRPLAILMIYLTIIGFILLLISTIVPPLIVQTNNLLQSLPITNISDRLNLIEVNMENFRFITNQLDSVRPFLRVISSTFSGLITFFTFSVITFYLLMERGHLHKHIAILFPKDHAEQKAEKVLAKIENQIGSWVRGEIILMLLVGFITYIGLTLLNIQYALPLAIFAGLLEIIPNIGPTISAIPAVLAPLLTGQSPIVSVFVIALYILVQQLENNLIVPKVMQSAVGVHPLVTIILLITGLKVAGISGAILAVPLFLVLKVIFVEIIKPYYLSRI